MSRQSFSEKNLETVLKYRKKQSRIVVDKESNLTFSQIENKVNENDYNIGDFLTFSINKNDIYHTASRDDDVVISKLDYNIRSIYKVKQKDRHTIVKQILSMLKEHTPKYIYRLDIKKFYESIDLNFLAKKLVNDNILSSQSEYILLEYEKAVKRNAIQGIPRGIGLSATLSEIYMKDFDKKISSNECVTYYTRFVDDILIISTKRLDIKKEVIVNLPENLNLNWKKTKATKVMSCYCGDNCQCGKTCNCWDKCKCQKLPKKNRSFSYLGYEYIFPEIINKNHSNNVRVGLSPSKFKKIKNRVYLSFKDYLNNGDFRLLNNRIRFLTGNHYLSRSKARTDTIKSGIYYNYIHLDLLDKHVELDSYLSTMINSWSSTKVCLNSNHKNTLNKYSFVSGFKNKNTTKFSAAQLNKIKGCWNNG